VLDQVKVVLLPSVIAAGLALNVAVGIASTVPLSPTLLVPPALLVMVRLPVCVVPAVAASGGA
jgi:hypothetical protein